MARHGIRHVLVCDAGSGQGRLERSLFALQRLSMREVGPQSTSRGS
jgi:hypothetical protein